MVILGGSHRAQHFPALLSTERVCVLGPRVWFLHAQQEKFFPIFPYLRHPKQAIVPLLFC